MLAKARPPALLQPFLPLKSLFRLGFPQPRHALFILFFGIDLAKRKLKVYCRNFWVQAEWRQLYVIFIPKKKNGKQRSPQLKKTRIYSIHFWNSYKVKKKNPLEQKTVEGSGNVLYIYIYIFRALIFLLIKQSVSSSRLRSQLYKSLFPPFSLYWQPSCKSSLALYEKPNRVPWL